MPDGLNEVLFIGALDADPEMRYTANGSAVTTFQLVIRQSFTGDDGERRDNRAWFRIVSWNDLAEMAGQQLRKGDTVYVGGRLATRSWDTPEGQKRYQTEIIARDILQMSSSQKSAGPEDMEDPMAEPDETSVPLGINRVMIIGNLGRDPEMRYTASGRAVTNFSVAVGRTLPGNGGERREETEWFRVVAWARQAETAGQYLTKGQKVFVEGRLATRSWDDQEGQKHYITELVASRFMFLSRPQGAGFPDVGGDIDVDDLPFS